VSGIALAKVREFCGTLMSDKNDSDGVVAAYIMGAVIAVPVGLGTWLWSSSFNSGLTAFAIMFIPAVVTFLVMNVAAENSRERARTEERLFTKLDSIRSELQEVRLALTRTHADSDDYV